MYVFMKFNVMYVYTEKGRGTTNMRTKNTVWPRKATPCCPPALIMRISTTPAARTPTPWALETAFSKYPKIYKPLKHPSEPLLHRSQPYILKAPNHPMKLSTTLELIALQPETLYYTAFFNNCWNRRAMEKTLGSTTTTPQP